MNGHKQFSLDFQGEKYYRKLTTRNTLLTLILFASPFLLLFYFINSETSSLIKNQINSRLAEAVDENIKTIDILLHDRELNLKSYSKLDVENANELTRQVPFFKSLIQEKKWYDFIVIADLEGNIVLSTNQEITGNIREREYFKVSKEGKFYNSGFFYSDILKTTTMVLSHPLMNQNGKIVGVLAAPLNLKNFYSLLFDLRLGETSELFLVDTQGKIGRAHV